MRRRAFRPQKRAAAAAFLSCALLLAAPAAPSHIPAGSHPFRPEIGLLADSPAAAKANAPLATLPGNPRTIGEHLESRPVRNLFGWAADGSALLPSWTGPLAIAISLASTAAGLSAGWRRKRLASRAAAILALISAGAILAAARDLCAGAGDIRGTVVLAAFFAAFGAAYAILPYGVAAAVGRAARWLADRLRGP